METNLEKDNETQNSKILAMDELLEKLKPLLPAAKVAATTGSIVTIVAVIYFALKLSGKI